MEPPELPECPVCLQPFDGESTIPRVLACGHSTCHSCLIDLPKPPFPRTIRCPACTQLVPFPHPQGPSALPKNIDLLRISSSLLPSNPSPNPNPKTPTVSSSDFIPNLWSHEFYCNWKDWVVPQDTISIDAVVALDGSFLHANVINSQVSSRYSTKRLQKVSLFKVGSFTHNDEYRFKSFNYSYLAKVLLILFKMTDEALAELELVLTSSSKGHRICTANYGLWYNEENEHLYLMCERKDTTLLRVIISEIKDDMSSFAMIAMELCEAVSRLHEAELVTGCNSLSCFGIDDFGHIVIDINEVLVAGQRVQKMITEAVSIALDNGGKTMEMNLTNDILEIHAFPSLELLIEFVQKEGIDFKPVNSSGLVGYGSDVWSLACILLLLLVGKPFTEETYGFLCSYLLALINRNGDDCEVLHMDWLNKVSSLLDTTLGSGYVLVKELLHRCLCLNPGTRPLVADLWKCMRELIIKPKFDMMGSSGQKLTIRSTCHCLLLGNLSWPSKKTDRVDDKNVNGDDFKDEKLVVESDVIEGLCNNSMACIDLKAHLDCISGLAIGGLCLTHLFTDREKQHSCGAGGFLFSSSFDKTVNVWSLQGNNHVHTFKGHEHKVMAVAFVNTEPPLCISADNGGEIFIWEIKIPLEEKAIKRLSEEKDWRYSGIHALAVFGSEYFYTGSGDKSIKAWSMHDYTLSCNMTGHKSVVSTLAVSDQVLYSGSWDGTIRLWCLSDHSPLAVLGEEAPGTAACGSILSLAAASHTLVAAHENGCIKIWNKDMPLDTISTHTSSIFSIYMEGQWLFSGGWNKEVVVQKLSGHECQVDVTKIGSIAGDSVVTALLYWQGKLFVGQADKTIKVYSFGG